MDIQHIKRFQPIVFLIFIFAVLEIGVWLLASKTRFLLSEIDLQTPAALYSKLDYIRKIKGTRVVFLGDSVVYGRRMEAAGDRNWRNHNIPAHVNTLLQARFPKKNFTTMNLSMNGALPSDIEQMVKLVAPLKVDCIVSDISLRGFSADFSAVDTQFSRPWLANMQLDAGFKIWTKTDTLGLYKKFETLARDFTINYWQLYRYRDAVQWSVFDGQPASVVLNLRNRLDEVLGGKTEDGIDPLQEILLTLKAKNRHSSIDLSLQNPQVAALLRTLQFLSKRKQCALFFYASEDKRRLAEIIDNSQYSKLQSKLNQIFSQYSNGSIRYISSLNSIPSEYYLDYGHLNDAGNGLVAKEIIDRKLGKMIERAIANP